MPDVDVMQEAVKDVAEVMKFEHWLRYYFVAETDGQLTIAIPETRRPDVEKYQRFKKLVDELEGRRLTPESSMAAVSMFVCTTLEGQKYEMGLITKVFDTMELRLEIHLFTLWLDGHGELLDNGFTPFEEWVTLFEEWKATEQVDNYVRSKTEPAPDQKKHAGKTTVH